MFIFMWYLLKGYFQEYNLLPFLKDVKTNPVSPMMILEKEKEDDVICCLLFAVCCLLFVLLITLHQILL